MEMETLTFVHLLAQPAIIPRAVNLRPHPPAPGSRARAIPSRSFGKDALLGGNGHSPDPAVLSLPPGLPSLPPSCYLSVHGN